VASLGELNEAFAVADRCDDERRIGRRAETVGAAFAAEAASLRPLPGEAFECFAELSCKVDTKARVCVRQSFYSVPVRLARRRQPAYYRLERARLPVGDGDRHDVHRGFCRHQFNHRWTLCNR
jgi:hypothetical protein